VILLLVDGLLGSWARGFAKGLVALLGEPQSMQQHSELAGDRDGGAFLGGFAAPLG
jgi:hypothetical protein